MALVTVEELRDYMDISFSNTQEDAANIVLAGLQSELESVLRRPVEVGTFTETWFVPEAYGFGGISPYAYDPGIGTTTASISPAFPIPPFAIRLNQSPVVSITSVTRQGQYEDSPTTLDAENQYSGSEFGLDIYAVRGLDRVTVTYTAGLDGDNIPYFKLVILRAAAREMQNMHDDTVGMKDLTTRNTAPLTTGFLDSEIKRLKRYRRHRI